MTSIHTIASGSSGNAALVSRGGTHILLDAGVSARRVSAALAELGLSPQDLSAICITHSHSDHISGLATMVKRVMNVTGFTDEQEATKMALVVRDIAERCRETMITDGSCGMREFKSWVLSTMITKDPYESAMSTIISSASADPDNRSDLVSTCLEKQYVRSF